MELNRQSKNNTCIPENQQLIKVALQIREGMLNALSTHTKKVKLDSYFVPFSDIIDELKPKMYEVSI